MKKIKAILIGAGARGMDTYADYALRHHEEMEFIAVAEPDEERRKKFQSLHNIKEENCFESWQQLLDNKKMADVALICTQDKMHYEPTVKAMELGYDILLEKPMAADPGECIKLGKLAKKKNRILTICYVLRYTPFFSTMKQLLDEGKIGDLISIQHNENVGYWHMAHSFVRGNWRNSEEASPMILQKSSHDMDIMRWIADSNCKRISSFGSLTHFTKENAPEGAPMRCLDGCKHRDTCAYYAPKFYLTEDTDWPTSVISNDHSYDARLKALKEGPYGRCVYHCDNNVVDHQVVNIEFENGVTAAFTMCAFTNEISRTIKLMGTKAELRGAMEKNIIEIKNFATGTVEEIHIPETDSGHSGGDDNLMRDFLSLVRSGKSTVKYSIDQAVESHIMAFAAEKARVEGTVIDLAEYTDSFKNK